MRTIVAIVVLFLLQALQAITNDSAHHIVFVQACNALQTTSSTTVAINIGATGTCSAGANPAAGHFVHIHVQMSVGPTSASCSDTLGSSWSANFSNATKEAHCFGLIVGGGADTVTLTTQSTEGTVISLEFAGMTNMADTAAAYNTITSSTSWTLPNAVTGNANDVVIGCAGNLVGNTYTASGLFIIPTDGQAHNASPALSSFCEYQIVSATGTYTPMATSSGSAAGFGYTKAFF